MAHQSPPSVDPLLADFQALVEDTERLLQESASLAGEQAQEMRVKLKNSLARARDRLMRGEDPLHKCCRATEHYVHTHPMQSLGMCALLGFMFGLMLSRR